MRRYVYLVRLFFRNALMNELEYRMNFIGSLVLGLFWLLWAALSVRVFFIRAPTIGGWTYNELLIVMGLFSLMDGIRNAILIPNVSRISEYVRLGSLDQLLTKPVNAQFVVSLRNLNVYRLTDPFLGIGLIAYALFRIGRMPQPSEVIAFAIFVGAAALVLYSASLILQTTAFWLTNVERADAVAKGMLETARFPIDFYQGWLRTVLTRVFPVGLLTTFPARALLGRTDWFLAAKAAGIAVALFMLGSAFWRLGLRHYNGVGG